MSLFIYFSICEIYSTLSAEGKHFYVYTVAGSAKFLRIYYAKVKEYLNALEETA